MIMFLSSFCLRKLSFLLPLQTDMASKNIVFKKICKDKSVSYSLLPVCFQVPSAPLLLESRLRCSSSGVDHVTSFLLEKIKLKLSHFSENIKLFQK